LIDWTHIIIHHSLTADGQVVDWQAIRRWHTGRHPLSPYKWRDIGYHFGVELVGSEYEVLMGRPLTMAGAHTKEQNMNRRGIGICCIGNFDLAPPPREMLAVLILLLGWLCDIFNIPTENIMGHHHFAPYKTCPGTQFDLEGLRAQAATPFHKGVGGAIA
jgi:N-acetylmuramoyl-L-alanine amidase